MGITDDDAFAATVAPSSVESDRTVSASGTDPGAPARATGPRLAEVPYEHFRTEREIARGGMGKIVAADDTRLGRPVALKVLLEPVGDSVERFQREALITARLQHPGIVPVYEAGRWPSGEPFFAMKLVRGKPLDAVIADATTLESRLALLPSVVAAADAIAYAHSQRIIHRDLKPANVLIGDFGETVVIDWGLAKDLDSTDESLEPRARAAATVAAPTVAARPAPPQVSRTGTSTLTIAGAVMGTPAYMAPEQARGESVDQRADVFALGAMLYHLLAGLPPYRARTATDVIAAAALGKVVPLHEHTHRAPRDLVAIVDRAMAQEPADRYPDAGALADELRRFLTGQLVGAHRYTAWQRISRFVRRHRAAVTISAVAVATIAIGGTIAIRDVISARDRADSERDLAVVRKQAAEALIESTFKDVETQLRAIGRLELLEHLGTEVSEYFDTLERAPGGLSRGDVARMVEAIELIGQAEQKSGKPDKALASWLEGRGRLTAVVSIPDPAESVAASRAHRRLLARLDFEIATNYQARGRVPDAMRELDASKAIYDALRSEDHRDRDTLLGSANTRDRIGDLLRQAGKVDAAFEEYSSAKADREAAVALPGGDPSDGNRGLATSHVAIGALYFARGDSATAQAEYVAALKLRRDLVAAQPGNLELQNDLLDIEDTLADLQRQVGDDRSAIASYRAAMPVVATLIARDPDNTSWRRQQGLIDADLGYALLDSGDYRGAIAVLDQAIAIEKALADADPKTSTWLVDLSRSYTRAGDAHLHLGELDAAIATFQLGLELRDKLVARDGKSVPYRRVVAWSHAKLSAAYRDKGDAARAIAESERAVALRAQLVDESPSQRAYQDELAASDVELGRLLIDAGGGDAATLKRAGELIASGVALGRANVDADALNTDWAITLISGLLAQADASSRAGDRATAAKALADALAIATRAAARASQNSHLPGYLGEIHAALAGLATDPAAARAEWERVRATLAPLAADGRLSARRRPLLADAVKKAM